MATKGGARNFCLGGGGSCGTNIFMKINDTYIHTYIHTYIYMYICIHTLFFYYIHTHIHIHTFLFDKLYVYTHPIKKKKKRAWYLQSKLWWPDTLQTVVFRTQLICMWAISWSYRFSPKLHLVHVSTRPYLQVSPLISLFALLCFPVFFPQYLFLPSYFFQPTSTMFTSSSFYSLSLVRLLSLLTHLTHTPISLWIPMDSHDFRRFYWNLFQTSISVRQWIPQSHWQCLVLTLIWLPSHGLSFGLPVGIRPNLAQA